MTLDQAKMALTALKVLSPGAEFIIIDVQDDKIGMCLTDIDDVTARAMLDHGFKRVGHPTASSENGKRI